MVASGVIAEPGAAFTADWIGHGGRAYVGRYALDPVRAITLVGRAGGVAVLAHPRAGRQQPLPDEEIARLAAAGLAGLEVFHPDHPPAERAALAALADDLGLVPTGGSDDHGSLTGHRIGSETTGPGAYRRLLSQATRPTRF
jgi:predicted metal-dependent phosphoesterase TrpH